MNGELGYMAARKGLMLKLHGEVWWAGSRFIMPLILISYSANYLVRPCWQSAVLAAAALFLLTLGWAIAQAFVHRGHLETGVRILSSVTLGFMVLVALLREGAVVSTVMSMAALLTYIAIFSVSFLPIAAGLNIVLVSLAMISSHFQWIPTFAQSKNAIVVQSVAYLVVMTPVIAYFLRAGQRLSESLFAETEAVNRKQTVALEALNRLEPEIAAAVRSISGIAATLATRAAQQAQTSTQMIAGTERLAELVAENTRAAADARSEAEGVQKQSADGRERLRTVEEAFHGVVERIEAVRSGVDRLASEIGKTEEVNGAIGEIALNLQVLSVNASLEAARAGESGKGFAVIALDLHRMISLTGKDLQNSSKLLETIRGRASEIATDSSASTTALRSSFDELVATGQLVEALAASFVQASKRLDAIAAAAQEHRSRIQEIAEAMRQFEEAAGELTNATRTLSEGVGRIDGAAQQLRSALVSGNA